jgi:hypothetical protein
VDITGILLISGVAFAMLLVLAVAFGPMLGWRIAAKHEAFVQFTSDSAPRDKIREAFRDLGWTLDGEAPDGMIARTKTNWRSWGEVVSLEFRKGGAEVRSECAFPSQMIDYGRNRMNVRNLIEVLRNKNA